MLKLLTCSILSIWDNQTTGKPVIWFLHASTLWHRVLLSSVSCHLSLVNWIMSSTVHGFLDNTLSLIIPQIDKSIEWGLVIRVAIQLALIDLSTYRVILCQETYTLLKHSEEELHLAINKFSFSFTIHKDYFFFVYQWTNIQDVSELNVQAWRGGVEHRYEPYWHRKAWPEMPSAGGKETQRHSKNTYRKQGKALY